MDILFIGLGSIGKRHARIINHYYPKYKLYRLSSKNRNTIVLPYVVDLLDWEEVDLFKPKIAFICNPTYLHIETAIKCAERGMHLFIEKPLCSNDKYLFDLIELVTKKNLITYIAYPFRFHKGLATGKDEMLLLGNGSYEIVCKTNINKWGKKSYSFNVERGGGAIFELSHEIDIAEWLFGKINIYGCFNKRNILMNLHSKPLISNSNIRLQHNNGIITKINLDIYSDKESRYISIRDTKGKELNYHYTPSKQMYVEQIHYFFNAVKSNDRFLINNIYEASSTFQKILEMSRR